MNSKGLLGSLVLVVSAFVLLFYLFDFSNFQGAAKEKHIVTDCYIFDLEGNVLWEDNGPSFCFPFSNGDLLKSSRKVTRLSNKDSKLLWELPMGTHHQLDLIDGELYFLSDEISPQKEGLPLRKDILVVATPKGRIERTYRYTDFMQRLQRLPPPAVTVNKMYVETTHLNSFYKIPRNPTALKIPAFKEGHFIFNDNRLEIMFILDSDFKEILWEKSFEDVGVHDVQVLETGKILLYHNRTKKGVSRIALYDPLTDQFEVLFEGSEELPFFSKTNGNVQVLSNGNIFFTMCNGSERSAIEFDPRREHDNIIHQTGADTHFNYVQGCHQFVRRIDATNFLERNPGL